MPDQAGRVALVTGANTGVGLETARVLARRGARVWLGCRSRVKAEAARASIRRSAPAAEVEIMVLDLANLASVRAASAALPTVDLLINNAGIMAPPRGLTVDGFELQFGVNHLGHFALTGLLLNKSGQSHSLRVVNVSSNAHHFGRMDFNDLAAERHYRAGARYAMSKLANLLFTLELDRRLAERGLTAVACHPGAADTRLARQVAPRLYDFARPLIRRVVNTPAEGALPVLRAATDPAVAGGAYIGPEGWLQIVRGAAPVAMARHARDAVAAGRLWDVSVAMTGVDPLAG